MIAAGAGDSIGDLLVLSGFTPSLCVLDIDGSLAVPEGFSLPAPWDLPSRLFRFPIEVHRPDGGSPRKLGLRHRLLADHPFVRHVEETLGLAIPSAPVRNERGGSTADIAPWWHAVDLVSAGLWRELIDTARFSTPGAIFRAIAIGLRHSRPGASTRRRGTGWAREILAALESAAPIDPAATIHRALARPEPIRPDRKREHWPVNAKATNFEEEAWALIFGVEARWLEYDRSGFLHWARTGRERYAAAADGRSVYLHAEGQGAFAF